MALSARPVCLSVHLCLPQSVYLSVSLSVRKGDAIAYCSRGRLGWLVGRQTIAYKPLLSTTKFQCVLASHSSDIFICPSSPPPPHLTYFSPGSMRFILARRIKTKSLKSYNNFFFVSWRTCKSRMQFSLRQRNSFFFLIKLFRKNA